MNQELINKYIVGNALPHEKEQVMKWIDESEEHLQQFMELRRIYDVSIWSKEAPQTHTYRKPIMSKLLWKVTKVAAVIALILMTSIGEVKEYFRNTSQSMQTITAPEGQRVQLALADGTKVWLNSNSTLQFSEHGFKEDERQVILNGEAYFEVKRAEKQPFIVKTAKYDIRVLGTSFNVSAYTNSGIFETSLVTGKVQINSLHSNEEIVLFPNDRLTVANGRMIKSRFASTDAFLWKDGIYSFDDETFEVIFKKLEQYYEVRIINTNQQLATQKCTGKFRQKEGIEQVIKVLQRRANFSYTRNEEENSITIK